MRVRGRNLRLCLLLCLVLPALLAQAANAAAPQVVIEGLDGKALKNARALLGIAAYQKDATPDAARIEREFARGHDEIRRALEPFGYYDATVTGELSQKDGRWQAHYRVVPGTPVRVRRLALALVGAGADDPALLDFRAHFPLAIGAVAEHPNYDKARDDWQKRALARGYLDARYRAHELRIDPAAHTAEVTLTLDTGPRYRFGTLRIPDSAGLDPALIEAYRTFQADEFYDPARVVELQRELEGSGYFGSVDVLARRDLADGGRLPVELRLAPGRRHRYSAGLGYGTDTGPRLKLGWERPRVNRAGHRMQVQLKLAPVESDFAFDYLIPLADPRRRRLDLSAAWKREDTDSQDSESQSIGASVTQPRGAWREISSLRLLNERFETGADHDTVHLLLPGIAWERVKANDLTDTRRGWRTRLDLRAAAEGVLSDTSLVQGEWHGKLIHPFGPRQRLITRAALGSTWVDDPARLPASLRFYAGGDQSVRGYDYQALGPRDESGEVSGGRHLLTASLELESRVRGAWGVAVFADTGNAYNGTHVDLRTGVGIGLRWHSPIGPVRADLAAALDEPGTPLRLHLTLGPDL